MHGLRLKGDQRILVDVSTEKRVLIRFRPKSWTTWDTLLTQGTGWNAQGSNQIMLCEIKPDTKRENARFQVVLGPGPKQPRDAIFAAIKSEGLYKQGYYPQWTTLINKAWRSLQNETATTPDEGAQSIMNDIEGFLANEGPRVEKALADAFRSTPGPD
jgi:hypothetical protein